MSKGPVTVVKPVVLWVTMEGYNHINPCIPIVERLITDGYEVHCFTAPHAQATLEALGCVYANMPFEGYDSWDRSSFQGDMEAEFPEASEIPRIFEDRGDNPFCPILKDLYNGSRSWTYNAVNQTAEFVVSYVQLLGRAPAFVIADHLVEWGIFGARILKVPLVIAYTCTVQGREWWFHKTLGTKFPSEDSVYLRMEEILNSRYSDRISRLVEEEDTGVRADAHHIVCTSEEFQGNIPDPVPSTATFVFTGALKEIQTLAPDAVLEFQHPFLVNEEHINTPLVYVAFGTVFNPTPALYRVLFDAFGSHDEGQPRYNFIVAVGRRMDIAEAFGDDVPDNFSLHNWVPQMEILANPRVVAFISHGGMNSVIEGCCNGLPMLVIPMAAEQPFNASRLRELGAGVHLPATELTVETARARLGEVIGRKEELAAAAARLGESFRRSPEERESVLDTVMASVYEHVQQQQRRSKDAK